MHAFALVNQLNSRSIIRATHFGGGTSVDHKGNLEFFSKFLILLATLAGNDDKMDCFSGRDAKLSPLTSSSNSISYSSRAWPVEMYVIARWRGRRSRRPRLDELRHYNGRELMSDGGGGGGCNCKPCFGSNAAQKGAGQVDINTQQ